MSSQFRTGPHHEFFEHLDWYREEDCARLPQELAWSRRECPVVHSGYDGGQYVVTRYDDLRTVGVVLLAPAELFLSFEPVPERST
jgi:hypothetical protein